jgi:hypothetical protein
MDPANPRPRVSARPGMSLSTVQMWVLSVLVVSTMLHFAGGLVLAAFYVDDDRTDAQVGLLVLAGVFGILSVLAGALIHRKRLFGWWLGLGLLPALVGAYFMFG